MQHDLFVYSSCSSFTIILLFAASGFDIGLLTKTTLNRSLAEGDASSSDENRFYEGVKRFFSTAFEYAVTHMPVNDPVLVNAQFVQFSNYENYQVDMPQYFVHRYSLSYIFVILL